MGLKTTNYELTDLGLTLPEAYAIIHELRVYGSQGSAVFHIQSAPRDKALELKPFKTVIVNFDWTRETNPLTAAYKEAKAMHYKKVWNRETKKYIDIENPNPFYGWEDDIIEGE